MTESQARTRAKAQVKATGLAHDIYVHTGNETTAPQGRFVTRPAVFPAGPKHGVWTLVDTVTPTAAQAKKAQVVVQVPATKKRAKRKAS